MSDAKVPLRFQIFKGDELAREEVLNQDAIKVGKLASSHLRTDDETGSRMHAGIESAGPDEGSLIDLGSTRGTTVNGERITKTRLQSGDEITFGDARVVVTFLQAADNAGARRTRAAEVQTVLRGVVTNTRVLSTLNAQDKTSTGNAMFLGGLALGAIALIAFVATAMSVGAEKVAYEEWQTAGKEAKNFVWQRRNPAMDVLVFGGMIGAIALSYMGLKRRTKSNPNFVVGSEAGVAAPVDPEIVPSPAHPLEAAPSGDNIINATPRMGGEIVVAGQSNP